MKFTLINRAGRVRTFFIRDVAELYQRIEGGVIVTSEILREAKATAASIEE